MLVKEVSPGEFLIWYGTNDLPASMEFTATAEELAVHGLYRPLPEDTTGPTPFHIPSGVTFERVGDQVQAVATFQVTTDVAHAREVALDLVQKFRLTYETALLQTWDDDDPNPPPSMTALFDARAAEHVAAIEALNSVASIIAYDVDDASAWPTFEDASS